MTQTTNKLSRCEINLSPDIVTLNYSHLLCLKADRDLFAPQTDVKYTSYANLVRSIRLPSGHTYRYVFKAAFNASMPTLLFLHGWPETSYSWVHQIEYFTRQGYGVVAPDMLGTGGTDNPEDLESFTFKRTAEEMNDLLEFEAIDKVVGVGHDIGCALLSRLQHYYPDRISALAYLTLGYVAPGVDMNRAFVDATNEATLRAYGYPLLGFWYFNEREDAAITMDQHLDALYDIAYGADSTWVHHITVVGALERWLLDDGRIPLETEYLTDVTRAQWRTIVQAQGGMDGANKWYRAMMRGYNTVDEEVLKTSVSAVVTKPALIVVGDNDPIAIPSLQFGSTTPFLPFLTVKTVPAMHFMQTEVPDDVNRHLHEFLKRCTLRKGRKSKP